MSDKSLKVRVAEALDGAETLAPLAGLFPENTGRTLLSECGLWGRRVELIADRSAPNSFPLTKGDQGHIGWSYPVTASIFNFAVEVPVEGLDPMPHCTKGVPWQLLKLVS